MKKAPLLAAGITSALVLGGGSTAFAMSNEVSFDVHGHESKVRMFGGTVEQALKDHGVQLAATDKVSPGLDTNVSDGITITVQKQRPVTIVIDGKPVKILTTATTVRGALEGLNTEVDLSKATIAPGLDTKLAGTGATITITTIKSVTFTGARGHATFQVKESTVGAAAKAHLGDLQPQDRFYDMATKKPVPADAPVTDGMSLRVERIRTTTSTASSAVPFKTVTKDDSSLPDGTTKVTQEGKDGEKQVVTETTMIDGKKSGEKVVSEKVVSQPVDKVVVNGTKKQAQSSDASSSNGASAAKPASTRSSSTSQSGAASGPSVTCTASHYGLNDGTDGGPTASGETFHAWGLTAASKSLPLGSRIRVTNTANGKSVVVRINDRGPYVGGRCLDLSAGAFSAIGSTGSGTMKVSYQRVG